MISPDLHFYRESTVSKVSALFFTFVESRHTSHEEMKQTTLKRDEEQVQAIVNHLSETMTDPFDIEDHLPCLMNISTGIRFPHCTIFMEHGHRDRPYRM
jgi:hypothetical protein